MFKGGGRTANFLATLCGLDERLGKVSNLLFRQSFGLGVLVGELDLARSIY